MKPVAPVFVKIEERAVSTRLLDTRTSDCDAMLAAFNRKHVAYVNANGVDILLYILYRL